MTYIKQLQEAYYLGKPEISNEEYDQLVRYMEEESIGSAGNIKHYRRMWSLDKKYPCRGDDLPSDLDSYVKTDKLDGCAVSLLYHNGTLVRGLSRGDGILGNVITDKLALLVPNYLEEFTSEGGGYVQVTGEVCVTAVDVENRRNFASGALNPLSSTEDFQKKALIGKLQFVAYNVQGHEQQVTYTSSMHMLSLLGFSDIITVSKSEHTMPTDGIVYRLNNNKAYSDAGVTAKFPKGALAVKEDEEGVETSLLSISWQTGASGKLTPVANFETVVIDDANISRATLNNLAYMEALGITHIGQTITIIRSGGIIPRVIKAVPVSV